MHRVWNLKIILKFLIFMSIWSEEGKKNKGDRNSAQSTKKPSWSLLSIIRYFLWLCLRSSSLKEQIGWRCKLRIVYVPVFYINLLWNLMPECFGDIHLGDLFRRTGIETIPEIGSTIALQVFIKIIWYLIESLSLSL